ncbi:hypothetical protein [Cochleicola gelatinilyticus]|uniref:Uncharacterized protein n=1 Tax=Cochleicola gelatinilyticus TaxID=1763537 RepID=A0A167EM81_9FLAO|nr:hypothetical protein [Cochleicola gelatinilyticus]OAB75675.1 hypothetical protein ULVI_14435 [Cochleicola gelatinilyticus]
MLKLDQKLKRVEIKDFELNNDIVFTYFDNLPSSERDDKFIRALYIGVLALMEDRFSAFLSKTSNELGTELESLKMIFEMKKEVFYKSTIKGTLAEDDIAEFLNEYFKSKRMKDVALLTGNSAGELPRNKTGDIICEINGESDLKIAIECKFDKSVKLGEIESKNIFTRKTDTAWSQLIESNANRNSKVSLIVYDISLVDNSILKFTDSVGYIPEVGFVSIVDSQKGDYNNLIIAYMLARDIAINAKDIELEKDVLAILITRIIKDINEITTIKVLVERNIDNNKDILKQIEKSMLLMDFNQKYLTQFLQTGTLTKKDLLDFYSGEGVKDQYKLIEKDINKY